MSDRADRLAEQPKRIGAYYLTQLTYDQEKRDPPPAAVNSGRMDVWNQLDDFCDHVGNTPMVKDAPGPFSLLREAREALGSRAPDRLVALGWELFLSRRRQGNVVRWHLSAKLYPQGRVPTLNDWEDVRRIAARVGALTSPALVARGPRAAVHWSWPEL
jgi:hypothetical protein